MPFSTSEKEVSTDVLLQQDLSATLLLLLVFLDAKDVTLKPKGLSL